MSRRTERIGDLLKEELSELLRRQIKDPRIDGFLTITSIEVSGDLKHAKVFVSILGAEAEKQEVMKGLGSASGFLRHQLQDRLTLRYTPDLIFVLDDSGERAAHLLHLMSELKGSSGPGADRQE